MTYVWIFLGGMIWDAIITVDTIATIKGNWLIVFVSTFFLTTLSCTVYNEVFVVVGFQIDRVMALSLGSSTGAASLVFLNNWRIHKNNSRRAT
jgi:hypothetical protein